MTENQAHRLARLRRARRSGTPSQMVSALERYYTPRQLVTLGVPLRAVRGKGRGKWIRFDLDPPDVQARLRGMLRALEMRMSAGRCA